ncbi:hypothetical protein [Streptococcus sp. HF-2466]|uniref:hypothetical protein n=1 Tax=Streptococcus sp. HF-2466 TaxID=2785792 RepID=UPI00189E262A|nr:hypothetical protein [Streptococcus sp. HF-2466]MBF7051677.1 hypothetical protein [Streptococcus sp. HF-2466]
MTRIKGITVTLIDKVETGSDPFGAPIFEDRETEVKNVLVVPTQSEEIINQMNLFGKKAVYTLGIPKGDTYDWEDKEVRFFGKKWRVFGPTIEGIDHLVPLEWNKKVMVERYE